MQIDQYGFEATSQFFRRLKLQPHRIDEATANVTYCCFDDGAKRPIHRITKSGTETIIEWAYGAWEDRAGLLYVPINQTLEV